MTKFSDDGPSQPKPDSLGRPEVQYVLVGTLIGAILLLIVLSVVTTL
jgi:hypothetical protein